MNTALFFYGFATGAFTMLLTVFIAGLILVGRCASGDKASDSEHTDL
jgi:hypothetical protein